MDIDFVVLWVDGSDPVWQAEKAKYQGKSKEITPALLPEEQAEKIRNAAKRIYKICNYH